MLIAEELVLLALEPDGTLARGASGQSSVAVGVTGALVAELVLDGHVEVGDGRIHLTGSRPAHPMLAQALDNLAPHEGKKLTSRLGSVKHAGWKEVVDAMVDTGTLGREKDSAVRPTRHPVADRAAHAELLAEMRTAATQEVGLEDRRATLLALTGPCYLLEVVAPDRGDRKVAKRRIDEAVDRVPAAAAVKHVIDSMNAVIAGAAVVGAVASSSG